MTIDWSKAPEGATHYCEDAIVRTGAISLDKMPSIGSKAGGTTMELR